MRDHTDGFIGNVSRVIVQSDEGQAGATIGVMRHGFIDPATSRLDYHQVFDLINMLAESIGENAPFPDYEPSEVSS